MSGVGGLGFVVIHNGDNGFDSDDLLSNGPNWFSSHSTAKEAVCMKDG
jgi:hypothetical protein